MENHLLQTLFADGIGALSITDGVARIELISMVQGPDNKPNRQQSGTLVMPLLGFVRAFQDLEGIINKLVADGVLQRADQQSQSAKSGVSSETSD